jgi:hypothetical protein
LFVLAVGFLRRCRGCRGTVQTRQQIAHDLEAEGQVVIGIQVAQ